MDPGAAPGVCTEDGYGGWGDLPLASEAAPGVCKEEQTAIGYGSWGDLPLTPDEEQAAIGHGGGWGLPLDSGAAPAVFEKEEAAMAEPGILEEADHGEMYGVEAVSWLEESSSGESGVKLAGVLLDQEREGECGSCSQQEPDTVEQPEAAPLRWWEDLHPQPFPPPPLSSPHTAVLPRHPPPPLQRTPCRPAAMPLPPCLPVPRPTSAGVPAKPRVPRPPATPPPAHLFWRRAQRPPALTAAGAAVSWLIPAEMAASVAAASSAAPSRRPSLPCSGPVRSMRYGQSHAPPARHRSRSRDSPSDAPWDSYPYPYQGRHARRGDSRSRSRREWPRTRRDSRPRSCSRRRRGRSGSGSAGWWEAGKANLRRHGMM